MLESIANSNYGYWTVAILIVLFDSVLLLAPGEYIYRVASTGKIDVRVPASPFLMRNKEVVFAILVTAGRSFKISTANHPYVDDRNDIGELSSRSAKLNVLIINVYFVIAMLLVVGPVLTFFYGVGNAILATVGGIYINAVGALAYIFLNRVDLGVSRREGIRLLFELLICPILVVNINKRFARKPPVLSIQQIINDDSDLRTRVEENIDLFDEPPIKG